MSRRATTRWVGALILILAVTASRHNFPLRRLLPMPQQATQPCEVRASTPEKKGEGVVPSRRHVETRRAEWVRTLALDAGLHPNLRAALERHNDLVRNVGARRDQTTDWRADETVPNYLQAFLPSQPSRALPPPA